MTDTKASVIARACRAVAAEKTRLLREVVESRIKSECPSCHGLNTSCPDGCGRDPVTGELNGTRLTLPDEEGMVEEIARIICDAAPARLEAEFLPIDPPMIARAILPLIRAAREQGARDMRERAAKKLEREWPGPAAKIVRSLDVSRGEG